MKYKRIIIAAFILVIVSYGVIERGEPSGCGGNDDDISIVDRKWTEKEYATGTFELEDKIKLPKESDFIFTFKRIDIGGNKTRVEELSAIDDMMSTGMTHAGITIRPPYTSDVDSDNDGVSDFMEGTEANLNYLKNNGYKIVLNVSSGFDSYERPELMPGSDDSKYLTISDENITLCDNWNNLKDIKFIDPSYDGVLWDSTKLNLSDVVNIVKPDTVLFDTEVWHKPEELDNLLKYNDADCDASIVSDNMSFDEYKALWQDRGLELKTVARVGNKGRDVCFYGELAAVNYVPVPRCTDANEPYTDKMLGMPANTGDNYSPSMYFGANIKMFDLWINNKTNQINKLFINSVPWVRAIYETDFYDQPVKYHKNVSREIGRMLRKAGARGFILFKDAFSEKLTHGEEFYQYVLDHSQEMILGFKEGLTYKEQNLIKNGSFEAFRIKTKNINCGDETEPYDPRFVPNYFSWTDTDSSVNDGSQVANLVTTSNTLKPKKQNMYSWRHKRSARVGNRTIISDPINIAQSGKYQFEIDLKTLHKSNNLNMGNIQLQLISKNFTPIQIASYKFNKTWKRYNNVVKIPRKGEYRLNIIISVNSKEEVETYIDNLSLVKK